MKRVKVYYLAEIYKTTKDLYADYEGTISKIFIPLASELPEYVEVQRDGRRIKAFWTYEEAELYLNDWL